MNQRVIRISLVLLLFIPVLAAQSPKTAPKVLEKKDEEALLPLTAEERSLSPRDIVANQPDFVADLTFFRSERFSGGGGSERVARKGNRYRKESEFWIFVGETGKPAVRLSAKAKLYDDLQTIHDESASGFQPFNPKTLALEPDVTFKVLGAVMIDGHRCIKIEAARKNKPEKIYLYATRDFKDLIIAAQIFNPPRGFVQRLSNVSLEVPASLVEIPGDYKPIEHDHWLKMENASVTYKGRPSKNYGVFRAPGGQLFIWISDAPYPWHYLVRPHEAIREVAFQGLLVTRAGEYVWETKELEAFSLIHYRTPDKPSQYDREEDRRVVVTPNSVKFRSIDYDKDKALIEVRW